MRLIPEWKKAPHMFSTQALLIAGTLQSVWIGLPADWRASIPETWVTGITIAVLVLGVIGRVVEQPKVSQ